jgi:protein-L-isoaspartate(D-aspartate) O-methyltransferase
MNSETRSSGWLLVAALLWSGLGCAPQPVANRTSPEQQQRYEEQRRELVAELRAQGISKPAVLEAMLEVPRHEFVPAAYRHQAYDNHPLPIGHDQTISQPYIVAYMTEAAEITSGEKVLEIGTGSGYQAAVLAKLAKEVYTIEIIPELAQGARAALDRLGYQNVQVRTGNGYLGWPEKAPFDAIVVTAAPDEIPQALVAQLAPQGKMVVPVGTSFQQMTIITKTESGVVEQRTIPVVFVPMVGKPAP